MQYFTIDEAEKILPTVNKQVRKLQQLRENVAKVVLNQQVFQHAVRATNEDGFVFLVKADIETNLAFHKACHAYYKELQTLCQIGAVLKDVERGVVDFYHKLNGRDICLCWQVGENSISHWHESSAGYSKRKKLVNLDKAIGAEIVRKLGT